MEVEEKEGESEMLALLREQLKRIRESLKRGDEEIKTMLVDTITPHDVKALLTLRIYFLYSLGNAIGITLLVHTTVRAPLWVIATIFVLTLLLTWQGFVAGIKAKYHILGKVLATAAIKANRVTTFVTTVAMALADGTITPEEAQKILAALRDLLTRRAKK